MIIVSGKTFEHRETIKTLGGKWNGTDKTWQFADGADVSSLRGLPGVRIDGAAAQTPSRKAPAKRPAGPASVAAKITDATAFYGNTDLRFNTLADQNPMSFAGFKSLNYMCDFVENIRDARSDAWRMDAEYREFTGVWGMSEALIIARTGWSDGVKKAMEALEVIETDHASTRQRKAVLAGGRVNVGRMLTGDPLHMIRRTRQPSKKVITLFVELGASAVIEQENLIIRAAAVAAMCDILETNEYSCEVVGVHSTRTRTDSEPLFQTTVELKSAGEHLNLNDLVFALGHPAMLRRLIHGINTMNPKTRPYLSSMGIPSPAFTDEHPTATGEFCISKIAPDVQDQITGKTFKDRVRSMFPLIVPAGFPVSLTE